MSSQQKLLFEQLGTGLLLAVFVVNFMVQKKRMEKMAIFGAVSYEVAGLNVDELRKKFKEYESRKIVYEGKPYRDPMIKPLEVTMLEGKGIVAKPAGGESAGGTDAVQVSAKGGTGEEVKIEGVIWGQGKKSMAIISGTVIAEGESVGAVKLISVSGDKVVLEKDGVKLEIKR